MKKLMTMISAVALAVGVQAADSGTSFESNDFTVGQPLNLASGEGLNWVTNGAPTLTVEDITGAILPLRATHYASETATKALAVQTTFGQPVYRANTLSNTAMGEVYVDTLVKPTICDSEDITLPNDAKIAIWFKEVEGANDTFVTNLMITAGYITEGDAVVKTNYNCGAIDGDPEAWQRFTIKSFANISTGDTPYPGFVVYRNKRAVECADAKGDALAPALNSLAAQPAVHHANNQLFPSLVTTSATITSIGFDGTGSVDDILFTDEAEDFAAPFKTFNLAWDEYVTGFTYQIGSQQAVTKTVSGAGSLPLAVDVNVTVYITNVDHTSTDYVNAPFEVSGSGITANSNTFIIDASAVTAASTGTIKSQYDAPNVVIGDGTEHYIDLASAFAAVNGKTGPVTMTLATDLSLDSTAQLSNSGLEVTLDLAGNTITYTGSGYAINAQVPFTITNSTVEVGGIDATQVVTTSDALTIYGGEFTGAVAVTAESEGTVAIYGGTFAADYTDAGFIAPGYKATEREIGQEEYVYDVGIATYAISYLDADGETALLSPGSYQIGDELTPATPTKDGYEFAGWTWYTWDGVAATPLQEYIPGTTASDLILVASWTETVTGVAQIGGTKYETFAAALAAAADGDTITLLDNVTEAPFTINVAKFNDEGLTIDLGGNTYTFNGGSGDGIYLLSSNKLTIANGTLAAASGTAYRDLVRDYNSVLTLNNVTVDGTNFPATDGAKLACLICVEGGGANIIGNTSIINVKPAAYAIKLGNHAQAWYEMGTTTVNTTGNIMGNVLIAGGVYNEVAVGSGSTIKYYYGKNVHSTWEDGVSSANFEARIGTLPTAAGTQDNVSGQLFKTLKDAVDAASAGATVTTLKNCVVNNGNTGITFTNGINLVNNNTITIDGANYALRIANGTTTPVTMSGTGSLVWANGSGSPILVGCNEIKSGYGINAFCEGSFVLNGGTLTSTDKTAKGGNLVKLEAGTFVLNGGTINGGTRGVKADSEGNNATCVLTINGGTIVNTNSAAIAASTAGSGSSTVVVNGGTFTGKIVGTGMVTIPGTSTAKFDRDQSSFCASGYETTLSDGWYVVTAIPIVPGGQSSTTYTDQAAAEAAAAVIPIAVPTEVAEAISESAANDYKALFEAKVVSAGEGQYKVVVDLKPAVEAEIQEDVDDANTDTLGAVLAAETDTANVSVTTKPGLYYQIVTGNSLPLPAPDANKWVMAEGDSSTIPVTKPEGDAAFFKVYCSPTK